MVGYSSLSMGVALWSWVQRRQAVVEVPTPGETFRVSVIARDEAHNRSDPLFAEYLIPDGGPAELARGCTPDGS